MRLRCLTFVSQRYTKLWNEHLDSRRPNTTAPENPTPPSAGFDKLGQGKFHHPAYGTLAPCLVPSSLNRKSSPLSDEANQTPLSTGSINEFENPHTNCTHVFSLASSRRLLANTPLDRPTYVATWDRSLSNLVRFEHFDSNLFNATVAWSNADIRRKEGLSSAGVEDEGDILIELDQRYNVEWVAAGGELGSEEGDSEEGLAFTGNFWGKEGPYSEAPAGVGKGSAEVWFSAST